MLKSITIQLLKVANRGGVIAYLKRISIKLRKIFSSNLLCNIHITYLKSSNDGGILIEFAFSVPILVSLLLFVCDHYRIYELKNKIKASAYLTASMVQQIGNTRTDKQLTIADLVNITYASCLNFFNNNSMFSPFPFGISYSINFIYVKRLNSNSYQFQHSWASTEGGDTPQNMWREIGTVWTSPLKDIVAVNPKLVLDKDGDELLYINCAYRRMQNFNKSKIGLYILDPQLVKGGEHVGYSHPDLLYYEIFITPKPGLFPIQK